MFQWNGTCEGPPRILETPEKPISKLGTRTLEALTMHTGLLYAFGYESLPVFLRQCQPTVPLHGKLPQESSLPASAPHVYQQSVPRLMVWWFKACEPRDAGELAARNSPTPSVTRYSMPHACARRGHYHRHSTSSVGAGYSGEGSQPPETATTMSPGKLGRHHRHLTRAIYMRARHSEVTEDDTPQSVERRDARATGMV